MRPLGPQNLFGQTSMPPSWVERSLKSQKPLVGTIRAERLAKVKARAQQFYSLKGVKGFWTESLRSS